jgi:hypothetical protein
MPTFDVAGARQNGFSDDDILTELTSHNPHFDVQGALKAGFSKADIINEMSSSPQAEPTYPSLYAKPAQPAPTFGSELYSNIVQPVVDLGRTIMSGEPMRDAQGRPTGIAANMLNSAWEGAKAEGRQAWDAATGQGRFEGQPAWRRALAATGYGAAAALPVVGPLAAKAGESAAAGNYGAAAADMLTATGPEALGLAGKAARTLGPPLAEVAGIPSFTRATQAFDEVSQAAKGLPVDMTQPAKTLAEMQRLKSAGSTMPRVAQMLINRIKSGLPIPYEDARDFVSKVSSLSENERNAYDARMTRQLGQLRADLHSTIAATADTVGQGNKYRSAVSEYRAASVFRDRVNATKAVLGKTAIGAAKLGGAAKLYNAMTE